jgi:hypothetical protein
MEKFGRILLAFFAAVMPEPDADEQNTRKMLRNS